MGCAGGGAGGEGLGPDPCGGDGLVGWPVGEGGEASDEDEEEEEREENDEGSRDEF